MPDTVHALHVALLAHRVELPHEYQCWDLHSMQPVADVPLGKDLWGKRTGGRKEEDEGKNRRGEEGGEDEGRRGPRMRRG